MIESFKKEDVFAEMSFLETKENASKNIGSLLKDLQDFERAIQDENIQDIYRIYNGRLHKELKETSNQNHEIDHLLFQKLHESFTARFPFMKQSHKLSSTVAHYQIGQYYRERAAILMDASIPELQILPDVKEDWLTALESFETHLVALEKQMDELEAKQINAKVALAQIDEKINELQKEKAQIENNKGFFNRSKIEEDFALIQQKMKQLQKEKDTWLPFITDVTLKNTEKEKLQKLYQDVQLKRALITKEHRLIQQYFGSFEEMQTQIAVFLETYLLGKEGAENE